MKKFSWNSDFSEHRHSDRNLQLMCQEGIDEVRAGHYNGLSFNLFNKHEAGIVAAYMAEHAPDIPYSRNWLFP